MHDITSEAVFHGYTLGDLDRIARSSVRSAWTSSLDYRDRYDAAWHAIAELLSTTEERPSAWEMKAVGIDAVVKLGHDEYRHHGYDPHNPDAGAGGRPYFQRYWALLGRATPSPEDGIVDRIALTQIWPTLSGIHRKTLLALAVHEDHALASKTIERTPTTYRVHLKDARRNFLALWHEHETPSRMWGRSMGSKLGARAATQLVADRRHKRARLAAKTAEEAA